MLSTEAYGWSWDKDSLSKDQFMGHAVVQGVDLEKHVTAAGAGGLDLDLTLGKKLFTKKSMNKYVGGNIRIRLQTHKLLKISVVEASDLAKVENSRACQTFCKLFWNQQELYTTSKSKSPLWPDEISTLKWNSSVMDAVPLGSGDNSELKVSKNTAMIQQMRAVMSKNGGQPGDDEFSFLKADIYNVLARFGEYIDANNVKLSQLFQAMDCAQNGYLGKADLANHFAAEANFQFTEKELTLLIEHLDEDGNQVIDLNELEVLMEMSTQVGQHKKRKASQNSIAANPVLLNTSASEPAISLGSPRTKLQDAIALDGEINGPI